MKRKLSIEQSEAQAKLIALANDGKLAPDAAEQRALQLGCAPLTSRPEPTECNPLERARWTLIMTLAWIAWRNLNVVRESSPEFAEASTTWRGERATLSNADGGLQDREVWSIVRLPARTFAWLRNVENLMRSHDQLPKSAIPIADAWMSLRLACERGDLIARAVDCEGEPTHIPQAGWNQLQMFDERNKAVLKRAPLDPRPTYTEVSFRRSDVTKCWAPHGSFVAIDIEDLVVEKSAYALLEDRDEEFVPLSSAIYWIATRAGSHQVKVGDAATWETSAKRVSAKIQAGKVELIGRTDLKNEGIPGIRLAGIPIRSPGEVAPFNIGISASSHISCSMFLSRDDWLHDGGDRFYPAGSISPTHTHLQVRNSDVLNSFPQPAANAGDLQAIKNWLIAEMRASPSRRPKTRPEYQAEGATKYGITIGTRAFKDIWREAMREAPAPLWAKSGPSKGSVQHTNRVRNAGLKKR